MWVNPLFLPTLVGTALFFRMGWILQRKLQTRAARLVLWTAGALLACPGILYVLYYMHLLDDAAWLYNVRTLRYTELLACGVGLLAGAFDMWWEPDSFGEKAVVPAVLLVLVAVPYIKPVLDPLDSTKLKDQCEGEVCLQSTFSTCGPASAATLLKSIGKTASEKELARESFTSRGGTEIWYLARALQKRGVATSVVIRPRGETAIPSPAIAGVVLPGNAGHFIAILSSDEERVAIADPLKGKFVVAQADLANRYRFTGFFLVLKLSAQ